MTDDVVLLCSTKIFKIAGMVLLARCNLEIPLDLLGIQQDSLKIFFEIDIVLQGLFFTITLDLSKFPCNSARLPVNFL